MLCAAPFRGTPTDQALVQRCLENDQDACAVLVDRYQRMVQTIVWRTASDRSHVDDMVQETFMHVFRGLRHFGARSKLSTWICTIAYRVAIDHQRYLARRACERRLYPVSDGPNAAADPEYLMAQHEVTEMLREELNLLADGYRLPLLHVAIRELRYSTVSQLLNMPLGTVKANVFYARRMLRERLQRRLYPVRISTQQVSTQNPKAPKLKGEWHVIVRASRSGSMAV